MPEKIVQVFTTPGNLTLTVPAGAMTADFECIGGGASGTCNGIGGQGSGGGAGSYGGAFGVAVTSGQTFPAVIGAGGAQTNTELHNNGGDTSVGSPVIAAGYGGASTLSFGGLGTVVHAGGNSSTRLNAEPGIGGGGGGGPVGIGLDADGAGNGGAGDGGAVAGGVFGIGAPNGTNTLGGFGGGGGGASGIDLDIPTNGGNGGLYGGGGGQAPSGGPWFAGAGANGAIRVTWYVNMTLARSYIGFPH